MLEETGKIKAMRSRFSSAVLLLFSLAFLHAQKKYDLVVAPDGTGDVRTVQEGLDKAPDNGQNRFIILVKNGIYNEKIFIRKSNVALIGEHADSTKIVFAVLRKHWNATMFGNDWGSAVINIDSTVSDFTMMNITAYNSYGSLSGSRDHQFTIWGKGTRIILYNCRVISDGGDAVSLWNTKNGMYYHAKCHFEGWVDYVCPRGWCFITGSTFYGHNVTASLWHDGSYDKEQKFVITNSYFDGVKNFPLGRHHRDGQFIFINNTFSKNLADSAIHYPVYSPNAQPWKWGRRHYYFNNHRDGGDYQWFTDNLDQYQGKTLTPSMVTPQWTFGGKWDPESVIRQVLERVQ